METNDCQVNSTRSGHGKKHEHHPEANEKEEEEEEEEEEAHPLAKTMYPSPSQASTQQSAM
ncbi:unnamed protein product, partial [Hydatigera taeniaeformis]|uniref:CTNNB1 binding N-teminal domain-containing protein n=1 Tax=Hydatigena taeniaeformis TaxID=6205 RepID=A0A0R3XDN6_HYDTA